MFISISEEVKMQLKPYQKDHLSILLSFDDGVGLYSKLQATCGLETHFDLVIVNMSADLTDYSGTIPTSIGSFFIKPYSLEFLDSENYLKTNADGTIILSGMYAGIVEANVRIIDLSDMTEPPKIFMEKTTLIP